MNGRFKEEELSGWGNIPKSASKVAHAWNVGDIKTAQQSGTILPRGMGRSYADQATNTGQRIVKMDKLNHFLDFDYEKGRLLCEAGVTLDKIITYFAPRGWFPMICPGTKFVTVGGAIANDIHGKAHHIDGSFVNCVLHFTILLADGSTIKADRNENSDLFFACFGGLGLLGTILTVCIRLRKIETTYFKQQSIVAHDLNEMLEAIDANDHQYNYSVAWIDSLAVNKKLGRGVLAVGNEAGINNLPQKLKNNPLKVGAKPRLTVPFYLPSLTLNRFTIRLLNKILYIKQKGGTGISHYESFFFPLDMINNWNRGYGKRGFIQYQFVVPEANGKEHICEIMETITKSGCMPFLNVLKKFGEGNKNSILSFPMKGYTFAIDFPITSGLKGFTHKLDHMVMEAGGRIYLGKDAYLEEATFKKMYPDYEKWLSVKKKFDPNNVYTSDIARRLGLVY